MTEAGQSAREVARRRREKSERLLRSADRFERGAEGELATGQALEALPPHWRVRHDARWPGRPLANLDHVVVGPGGVFVIDSKNWTGRIAVTDAVLRQNGRARPSTIASAEEAGRAVAQLVPAPYAAAVTPVLCFTSDRPITGWAGNVMVCSTANLVQMLVARGPRIPPDQVEALARGLDQALDAPHRAVAPAPAAAAGPPTWTREKRTSRRRRPRGRRTWAPGFNLVGLLGVLAAMFLFLRVGVPAIQQALPRLIEHETAGKVVGAFGDTLRVPGRAGRPPLDVTAAVPREVHSAVKGVRAARGRHLVGVPVAIRNSGSSTWNSGSSLGLELSDAKADTYVLDYPVTRLRAGQPLVGELAVPPGSTLHRVVVFELPRGAVPRSFSFTVGLGLTRTGVWSTP